MNEQQLKVFLCVLAVICIVLFGAYKIGNYNHYVGTRQKQHNQYIIDCGILFELNETECAWLWSQAQDRN